MTYLEVFLCDSSTFIITLMGSFLPQATQRLEGYPGESYVQEELIRVIWRGLAVSHQSWLA